MLKDTIKTVVKRIKEDAKGGTLVGQKQLTYKEATYDEDLAEFTCEPGSLLKGDQCGKRSIVARSPAHLCRTYPSLGSIVMTAFLHTSLFCASLGSRGCFSYRTALCPSTSVWALLEVHDIPTSSLLLPLQHSCRLFSLHGHTTKGVSS